MERKMKQVVLEWRKSDNKNEVIKQMQELLFKRKEQHIVNKLAKKVESKYRELTAPIEIGTKVKMKKNHQVGKVKEIRGSRAIVQIGALPMNINMNDLIAVEEK